MKKNYLLLVLLAFFCCHVYAQKQALILGYSQVENVYEDENVKVELVRLDCRITNKTNKTVYIDKKSSFYYVNENPFCLYAGKQTKNGNETIIEKDVIPIAPKSKYTIYYDSRLEATYSAASGSGKKRTSNVLGDLQVNFMGYVETLRYELANNQDQSASKLHLTGEDSFLKTSVSLNYTLDPKMESFTPVTLVTWVSDMVMAKYYVQPQDKVVKSRAVNVQGRMYNILHVFASAPFEYAEDESPLDMYLLDFGKGSFSVNKFNNTEEDKGQKKMTKKDSKDEEMVSNFVEKPKYKNIFIWEGESNNWVQAMTDSYQKFLEEDGVKPKDALKEAKEVAKNNKSLQTLKP